MTETSYLSEAQIADLPADSSTDGRPNALRRAREAMQATAQWYPGQAMGRRWGVGCVALEITQRCNLDCTLCYLSEHAEAVQDTPLPEIIRRIDAIHARYGDRTDVQVTGGDPTLRKREELIQIVREIAARNMRPSLFTNGIRATRSLLSDLAEAGLCDVAFHVDMTQQRKGYASESELNSIRREYLERARGLGLYIIFNTTVFDENIEEIPALTRWFLTHADQVSFASFQMQAETGRGVLGQRDAALTRDRVISAIETGAESRLGFGVLQSGHRSCNAYAVALTTGSKTIPFYDDAPLFQELMDRTATLPVDRQSPLRVARTFIAWGLRNPSILSRIVGNFFHKLQKLTPALLTSRGRVNRISFFVHNFMDACHLDEERVKSCVFMVESAQGGVSMCVHNAKRDATILQPLRIMTDHGIGFWDPTTGDVTNSQGQHLPSVDLSPKQLKGRRKFASKQAAESL